MGLGTSIEAAVDGMLQDFVTAKSAAICTALLPIAITGTTIHLISMGYAIMRGEADEPLHELLSRFLRISIIMSLALVGGTYQTMIVGAANGLESDLVSAVSGLNSVGALVDDMAKPFADLGAQLWSKAVVGFWPNFGLVFSAALVAIAEFFIIPVGLGMYLLAKIALALLLAVGPAFIFCALWKTTEKYTESWVGQVVNYVLLKVLIAGCIAMLMSFASGYAEYVSKQSDVVNIIRATTTLLMSSAALGLVMLNIPQIATALAGGASLSGIGRHVGRAFMDLLKKTDKSPGGGGGIAPGRGGRDGPTRAHPARSPASAPLYNSNAISRLNKK